jgi:hypothetical protein
MDYYRHNQLAETVRCYQQFTSQFQTWLVNTAVQRGIEVASIVNNPTKKAKYKKTYNLPVENQEEIVNAVAAVAAPLMDISGLDDLRDALRLRKEVTEYHKYRNTADEGHEFINGNLEDLMATLRNILPPERRPRERQDKKPTFVYVRWSSTSTQVNQDALLEKAQEQGELELEENRQSYRSQLQRRRSQKYIRSPRKKRSFNASSRSSAFSTCSTDYVISFARSGYSTTMVVSTLLLQRW